MRSWDTASARVPSLCSASRVATCRSRASSLSRHRAESVRAWANCARTAFNSAVSLRAFDAVTFAYLFLGGVGIILFFRDRGWHPAGALVAALAFAFGGSANARLQHTGQIISLCWFALTLWLLARTLASREANQPPASGPARRFVQALPEMKQWGGTGIIARVDKLDKK